MDIRLFFGKLLTQMEPLSSKSLLESFQTSEIQARKTHIASMRLKYPKAADWSDDEIEAFCREGNSYSQSRRSRAGKELETLVEMAFRRAGQPFKSQVPINKDGIIVTTKKGMKVIDIVFGVPRPGDSITNYAVMSLKTSSRERPSEDDWTFTHRPTIYLYASLASDYPAPEKFQESETRKLVCATPKPDDTRRFKLGFEDILREVGSEPACQ